MSSVLHLHAAWGTEAKSSLRQTGFTENSRFNYYTVYNNTVILILLMTRL